MRSWDLPLKSKQISIFTSNTQMSNTSYARNAPKCHYFTPNVVTVCLKIKIKTQCNITLT